MAAKESIYDDRQHPYWTAPRGRWLVARISTDINYPCRCPPGCGAKCPCRGRTDLAGLPTSCCAIRARDTAARTAESST